MEFEHRGFRAPAPAVDLPVRANEFRVGMPGQIKQQRMLAAIELLRKRGQRLWPPKSAPSAEPKMLTSKASCSMMLVMSRVRGNTRLAASLTFSGGTIAFGVDHRFLRNQESIDRRVEGMAREL